MRTLVAVPHFDDEVFGAGGYLAKHADECTVLIMQYPGTNGVYDPHRHERSGAAVARISAETGVAYLRPMGFPRAESDLEEYLRLDDAIRHLEVARERVKPDRVIVPWRGDMHQDHRVVAEAALIAYRPSRTRQSLWFMEIPSSSERGAEPLGYEGAYVGIDLAAKQRLVSLYGHEFAPDRNQMIVGAMAQLRGAQSGLGTAEFFRVGVEVIP